MKLVSNAILCVMLSGSVLAEWAPSAWPAGATSGRKVIWTNSAGGYIYAKDVWQMNCYSALVERIGNKSVPSYNTYKGINRSERSNLIWLKLYVSTYLSDFVDPFLAGSSQDFAGYFSNTNFYRFPSLTISNLCTNLSVRTDFFDSTPSRALGFLVFWETNSEWDVMRSVITNLYFRQVVGINDSINGYYQSQSADTKEQLAAQWADFVKTFPSFGLGDRAGYSEFILAYRSASGRFYYTQIPTNAPSLRTEYIRLTSGDPYLYGDFKNESFFPVAFEKNVMKKAVALGVSSASTETTHTLYSEEIPYNGGAEYGQWEMAVEPMLLLDYRVGYDYH